MRSAKFESDTKECQPVATEDNKPIVPCGLIAWSLFNDTYGFSAKNEEIKVNKKDIAWKSDKDYKFGDKVYPKNFQNGDLIGGAKLNESIPVRIYIPFFHCIQVHLSVLLYLFSMEKTPRFRIFHM